MKTHNNPSNLTGIFARSFFPVFFCIALLLPGLVFSQGGPGGVGNATGSDSQPRLTAWYDASNLMLSGSSVTSMTDRSGNAHHAQQPQTSLRPVQAINIINNRPVVRFQGNQLLQTSSLPYDAGNFSLITVSRNNSTGNGTLMHALAWLGDWQYRKRITLKGEAGAGTQYQVLLSIGQNASAQNFNLHLDNNATSFPDDLRFTSNDGETLLSHWVEELSGNPGQQTAKVWVRVSGNLNTNQDIFVYYGNPAAVSASNPQSTFVFYDDFNRADVADITQEANYIKRGNGSWSIQGNQLRMAGGTNDPNKLIIESLGVVDYPVLVHTRMRLEAFGNADASRTGVSSHMDFASGEGYNFLFRDHQGHRFRLLNDKRSWGEGYASDWDLLKWYYMEMAVTVPSSTQGLVRVWEEGTIRPSFQTRSFGGGNARPWGYIGLTGSNSAADIIWYDYIMVRKFAENEPSFLEAASAETPASVSAEKFRYQYQEHNFNAQVLIQGSHQQVSTGGTAAGFSINSLQLTNTGASIRVNGSMQAQSPFSNPSSPSIVQFNLGKNGETGSQGLQGDIAELILYHQPLNESQQRIVDHYLSRRYNISLSGSSLFAHTEFTHDLTGVGITTGTHFHLATSGNGGALYLADNQGALQARENTFVLAAHNNSNHGIHAGDIDVASGAIQRWRRVWYLQHTGSPTPLSLGFDFAEAAMTADPNKVYILLYRAQPTEMFTHVPGTFATVANNRVWFEVEEQHLVSGYYTLAPLDNRIWYAYAEAIVGNAGYWDQPASWTLSPDGDYSNPSSFTPATSPSSALDMVVIPQGKRIVIRHDNYSNALLDIREGVLDFQGTGGHHFPVITGQGTMRLRADNFPGGNASAFIAETGGTVEFYGNHDIHLLTSRVFNHMAVDMQTPSVRVVLEQNLTLNGNLRIQRGILQLNSNTAPEPMADIRRWLVIRKNWTIEPQGHFRVGRANTNNSALQLGNGGGPYVLAGLAGLAAGSRVPSDNNYHLIYNQIEIWGNLLNRGTALFTNQSHPVYDQLNGHLGTTLTETGAAVVWFKGATNNTMDLYGTTDFYHLVIDKGNNPDRLLTVTTENEAHFRLFGSNILRGTGGGLNPEIRKALWIKNGTLHLKANVHIPTLTEGRDGGNHPNADFYIPTNGGLWIDGAMVYGTADSQQQTLIGGVMGTMGNNSNEDFQGNIQSTSFYGNFRITAGRYSTRRSGGLIVWAQGNPYILIEGGELDAAQFRSAGGTSQNNRVTLHIRGGTLNLRGDNDGTAMEAPKGTFSMLGQDNVFIQEAGTIRIWDGIGSGGAFELDLSPQNVGVSGGTVEIIMDRGVGDNLRNHYFIRSSAPIYNLRLTTTGTGTSALNPVRLHRELRVINSLFINDGIQFHPSTDNTVGPYHDLFVDGHFILGQSSISTAGYHPSSPDGSLGNTTWFGGSGNAIVTIANTIHAGALQFHNLVLNKMNSETLQLVSPGRPAANIQNHTTQTSPLAIRKSLQVHNGILDYNGFMIAISSGVALENRDRIGRMEDASGYLALAHPNLQVQLSALNEPRFGRIMLEATTQFIGATRFHTGDIYMREGIMDIGKSGLVIHGRLFDDPSTGVMFGTEKMILTAGNHSDLGLMRMIDNNGSYSFPLGINTKTSHGLRYTPAEVEISNFGSSPAFIQVNGVDNELATLKPANDDEPALQYYWRIRNQDFTDLPNIRARFDFLDLPAAYLPGGFDDFKDYYTEGKVVDFQRKYRLGSIDWDGGANHLHLIIEHANTNNDPEGTAILENGEFTAAHQNRFAGEIEVFFSKKRGEQSSQSLWGSLDSWTMLSQLKTHHNDEDIMEKPHLWHRANNPTATRIPNRGDIVIIGYNPWDETNPGHPHNIRIQSGYQAYCAELRFNRMLDASGNPQPITASTTWGNGFFFRPTFTITENAALHTNIISGEGTMRNRQMDPDYSGKDLGDFNAQPLSYQFYEIFGNVTLNNIPAEVPNLTFIPDGWGSTARTATLPKDITVNYNLEIQGAAGLRLNTGTHGDIHVKGNLALRMAATHSNSRLIFPNSGTPRRLRIDGDLYTQGGSVGIFVENPATGGTIHEMYLAGNYIQDAAEQTNIVRLFTGADHGRVRLHLTGNNPALLSGTNTTTPLELYRLVIEKSVGTSVEFQIPFTLGGPTSGAGVPKALELHSGRLVLNHLLINVALTTGNNEFPIPSAAQLVVRQGKINASGDGTGIFLDGTLRLENQGEAHFYSPSSAHNTYIHYSSGGTARLQIFDNALLRVGSQIRGSTSGSQEAGLLKYHQGGGVVETGYRMVPNNSRAVFEVFNPGSEFIMEGGTLVIARNQASAARAALYLDPGVSSLSADARIVIGSTATPANHTIGVNAKTELPNVIIRGPSTQMRAENNSITIRDTLYIHPGNSLHMGTLPLEVRGHVFNYGSNASFQASRVRFRGTQQQLHGSAEFSNLIVNPQTSLELFTNITVSDSLVVESGQLHYGLHTITARGHVVNHATITSPQGTLGGLILDGSNLQLLSGNGTYGRLVLNNNQGARLLASQSVQGNLSLQTGVLELQNHRLSLGVNSHIEGAPFYAGKMITTSGGIEAAGLEKRLATGTHTFTWPVGVAGKYTPVVASYSQSAANARVSMSPVNEQHITTVDYNLNRVLRYYWQAESTGLSDFTGEFLFEYFSLDLVEGNPSEYLPARLVGDSWTKLAPEDFFSHLNQFRFLLPLTQDVGGYYTAGYDEDIPAKVPTYFTTGSGVWTDPSVWQKAEADMPDVPSTGPFGHIVEIMPGHTITIEQDQLRSYITRIQGNLTLGTTAQHNLGLVSGSGTISLERGLLPAGKFDAFFSTPGSTIVYGGNLEYTLTNRYTTVQNLIIRNSGLKSLPNESFTVAGNLVLEAGTNLRHSHPLVLKGDFDRQTPTGFISNNTVEFSGSIPQYVRGAFEGGGSFENLQIDNPSGAIILENGVKTVRSRFHMLNGSRVISSLEAMLVLDNVTPLGTIHPASFVEGPLSRNIVHNGESFDFPVGKEGLRRTISLLSPRHGSDNKHWVAEYFFGDPSLAGMSAEEMEIPGLHDVSQREYWRVASPAGAQDARIKLGYGPESQINEQLPAFSDNIAIVYWDNTQWRRVFNPSASFLHHPSEKAVSTSMAMDFSAKNAEKFFTFGSKSPLLPLPIELIFFDAFLGSDAVMLEWVTATEINNDYFTLERSPDGENFHPLAHIASKAPYGFSNYRIGYQYPDRQPLQGMNYYRLMQTDFDGSFSFSPIIGIYYREQQRVSMQLFPNPNWGHTFEMAAQGLRPQETIDIQILDFYGRHILSDRKYADERGVLRVYLVPPGKLPPGVYFVTMTGLSGSHSMRMVVQ